jgi:sugar lactone lactonase YvrE
VAITGELTGISVISNVIDVPAIPVDPPIIVISFPPEKSMTEGYSIIVRGSATDAGGIRSVTVNGVEAISDDGFATWTAEVTSLSAGPNTLIATVTDMQSDTSAKSVQLLSAPLADKIAHLTFDSITNRFFVIENNKLVSVSGANGLTRRIDSVDSVNALDSVSAMQFDAANNRMIVLDDQDDLSTIKEVNLVTGARSIFSQDSIAEPEGTLSNLLYDLALDATNNKLYIADGNKGLVEMDLTTGNRSLLSSSKYRGLVYDAANTRLIATTHSSVVAINTMTGVSTILANNGIASATSNITLSGIYGIAYDSANNRVFVSALNNDQVIKIDLTDGSRQLLSDSTRGGGDIEFSSPLYMEYDAINERVLVADSYLIGVDANTGERSKINDAFSGVNSLGFDTTNNQIYAVKRGQSLVKFDLSNGTSTVIADNTIATGISDTEFGDTWGLEVNLAAGVAYITDWSASNVIEVNLATGARTTIADNSTGDAHNTFISPIALVLDDANNRYLVLDSGRGSVIEVDSLNGTRRVISSAQVPNRVNAFRKPKDMALDAANNRVLVLDSDLASIVAVDLDTGARTIMGTITGTFARQYYRFDLDSVNSRVLLVNRYDGLVEMNFAGATNTIIRKYFHDIVFNPVTGNAFALESDTISSRVLEIVDVDLTTGKTVIVPTGITPDNKLSLDEPFDIEINSSANVAYVSDTDRAAIITLNLDTGARTLLSDNTISTGLSNIEFVAVKGIVLDATNNRLLVSDSGKKAIIAVALDTGARTLVSDNTIEGGSSTFDFTNPRYIALDAANNRALVLDGTTLAAVSLATGARTILSDNSMAGIALSSNSDLTVDIIGNRVLIASQHRVTAVDLDTGLRTVLVDNSISTEYQSPLGITIDPQNNRIILIDNWYRTVSAIDLTSATRILLASGSGANAFIISGAGSVVYDPQHNRALVIEKHRDAIIAVDLTTGARVIFSQ